MRAVILSNGSITDSFELRRESSKAASSTRHSSRYSLPRCSTVTSFKPAWGRPTGWTASCSTSIGFDPKPRPLRLLSSNSSTLLTPKWVPHLQAIVDVFAEKMRVNLNIRKTKVLHQQAPKEQAPAPTIRIHDKTLENVGTAGMQSDF